MNILQVVNLGVKLGLDEDELQSMVKSYISSKNYTLKNGIRDLTIIGLTEKDGKYSI